jgi:hypothetical protein
MKAAIVFLLVSLSAVATPVAAEWTYITENDIGDQFFIDLSTFKNGARPRAWFMTSYSAKTKLGNMSSKTLREADCSEGKIRYLAARFYTEPMGAGALTSMIDQSQDWEYVTPNTITEEIARFLCRGNR